MLIVLQIASVIQTHSPRRRVIYAQAHLRLPKPDVLHTQTKSLMIPLSLVHVPAEVAVMVLAEQRVVMAVLPTTTEYTNPLLGLQRHAISQAHLLR